MQHNRNLNIFEITNLEYDSGNISNCEVDRRYSLTTIELLWVMHRKI